jgi:hypothetical protein
MLFVVNVLEIRSALLTLVFLIARIKRDDFNVFAWLKQDFLQRPTRALRACLLSWLTLSTSSITNGRLC